MSFILKPLIISASIALASPMLAAASTCTGNIIIGEGSPQVVTSVANKSVNGSCLNDLIVDTLAEGANYSNHGEFVSYLTKLVKDWEKQGIITGKAAGEIKSAAAR